MHYRQYKDIYKSPKTHYINNILHNFSICCIFNKLQKEMYELTYRFFTDTIIFPIKTNQERTNATGCIWKLREFQADCYLRFYIHEGIKSYLWKRYYIILDFTYYADSKYCNHLVLAFPPTLPSTGLHNFVLS